MAGGVQTKFIKALLAGGKKHGALPEEFKKENVRNILLISTTAIGDTLMCTPAIRAIREAFKEARICALLGTGASMVLDNNPGIDEIIRLDDAGGPGDYLKLPGLVMRLKREKFDLAIVLHANDPYAVPLAYLSNAPFRLGMTRTEFPELLTWYSVAGYSSHVIEERLKALKPLGISSTDLQMELFLTRGEEMEAERILKSAGIKEPFACVHPFGSKLTRSWPPEYAAELIDHLSEKLDLGVVLLGGEKEKAASEKLAHMTRSEFFSTAGKARLRISAGMIKRAKLVVSTDSGPMHVAQAFGVPTVAVIGSTLASSTGPSVKGSVIVKNDSVCDEPRPCKKYDCDHISCMRLVKPKEVMDAVDKLCRV
jgi:heptosyltransferase-2